MRTLRNVCLFSQIFDLLWIKNAIKLFSNFNETIRKSFIEYKALYSDAKIEESFIFNQAEIDTSIWNLVFIKHGKAKPFGLDVNEIETTSNQFLNEEKHMIS